jgi:SAM-dependent methyltransferase
MTMSPERPPRESRQDLPASLVEEAAEWEKNLDWQGGREWRMSEWERHLRPLGLSLGSFTEDRLLDVGCGPTGLVYFVDAAERVGLDPLGGLYERWNGHWGEQIDLVAAPGEQMPFDSDHFDTVVCVNCLDHTEDPAAVLGEIGRVMRPGGRLVFHVDLDSPLRKLHKLVKPRVGVMHPHTLTDAWLRAQLTRSGLDIELEHRDPEVFRATRRQMRYEAFWDGLAYRLSRSPRWMNHVWLRAIRR